MLLLRESEVKRESTKYFANSKICQTQLFVNNLFLYGSFKHIWARLEVFIHTIDLFVALLSSTKMYRISPSYFVPSRPECSLMSVMFTNVLRNVH
jgi:hypothetical protein